MKFISKIYQKYINFFTSIVLVLDQIAQFDFKEYFRKKTPEELRRERQKRDREDLIRFAKEEKERKIVNPLIKQRGPNYIFQEFMDVDLRTPEERRSDYFAGLNGLIYFYFFIKKNFVLKIYFFYKQKHYLLRILFWFSLILVSGSYLSYWIFQHLLSIDEAVMFIYRENDNPDMGNRMVYMKTFHEMLSNSWYEKTFRFFELKIAKIFPSYATETWKIRGYNFYYEEIPEYAWKQIVEYESSYRQKKVNKYYAEAEVPTFLDYLKTIHNFMRRSNHVTELNYNTAQIRNKTRFDLLVQNTAYTTKAEINDIRFDLALDACYNDRKEFKIRFYEFFGFKLPKFFEIIPPYRKYIDPWQRIVM